MLHATRTWNEELASGAVFAVDPDGTRIELVQSSVGKPPANDERDHRARRGGERAGFRREPDVVDVPDEVADVLDGEAGRASRT